MSCNVTSLPVYTCRHLGLYILIPITHCPVMLHLYLYIPVDILVISVYFNTYNSLSCNVTSLPVYTCRYLGLYILIPIAHCPVMLHLYLYLPVDKVLFLKRRVPIRHSDGAQLISSEAGCIIWWSLYGTKQQIGKYIDTTYIQSNLY